MDAQLGGWKQAADRLWSGAAFDHREAAALAAEIARDAGEPTLRQRTAQALPSLRAACAKGADRTSKDVAQRRFGAVRDCLHALTGPRFGKRQPGQAMPTENERCRRMLGLPLGRRLFGPEINRAYKQAAKKAHPDVGGDERAFLELSAARDALMKSL
jgi:hypothetical protein